VIVASNKGEVYFALVGDDFDPSEVTQLVGLSPTSSGRKGAPIPKQGWWMISAGKVEGEIIDVYGMSSALVERLAPYSQRIIRAKQQLKLDAVLEVVLWISTDDSISTPAIGFTPEVVSFLNSVGASIDIDTYRNTL